MMNLLGLICTGATLGKGINRVIGTLVGGVMGCLAAILGAEIGGIGKPIIIASSVFVFGGGATYCRMVPKIKKRYDYGFMIFILTFTLLTVSGLGTEKVVEVGRDRLATVGMGFAICIFVSLLICPIWSSNELQYSTVSKFDKLATSIQGCLDEYFKMGSEKENQGAYIQACNSVLNSKSIDESLANNAKWEPWHGKFGVYYPWEKYLEVGEHLRELAATIFSLKGCLRSPKQPPAMERQAMKEACEKFMQTIKWILKELGESIEKMELCKTKVLINPRLQSVKLQLTHPQFSSYCCKMEVFDQSTAAAADDDRGSSNILAITTFNFLLVEIVDKIEILAKKVEELGEAANFKVTKIDV